MTVRTKIKILITDDSVLFRSQIQLALKQYLEVEIVGLAANGQIALEKMKHHDIDLCILDLEMPELSGLDTLRAMKAMNTKTRAIIFTTSSASNADKTIEAMRLGAIDFVLKPLADGSNKSPAEKVAEVLWPKILPLYEEKCQKLKNPIFERRRTRASDREKPRPEVLVIAASTGGPTSLIEFFSGLNEALNIPILVVQHMPPLFTASFAESLAKASNRIAKEVVHGEILLPNQIYVAPGDYHFSIEGIRGSIRAVLDQGPLRNFVRPCADFLFESAAKIFKDRSLGIVFTGMGKDGLDGAKLIKCLEGTVFIQNRESSVVYGMPGAIADEHIDDFCGNPVELADKVLSFLRKRRVNDVA